LSAENAETCNLRREEKGKIDDDDDDNDDKLRDC
jgi:hypothetical protein